jgi:Flp pilus assembly protein TadG
MAVVRLPTKTKVDSHMKTSINPGCKNARRRCATAAVELAVCAPFVVGLLVGLLEIGRIVQVNEILVNAAREGARQASTGINTYSDVSTTVTNYLTQAGITNQTSLSVTVYNVTQSNAGPSYNPSGAAWMDQLKITVSLPLSNVRLAPLHFLSTDPNTTLTAQAVWFSNQDQSYPTTITPPSGS